MIWRMAWWSFFPSNQEVRDSLAEIAESAKNERGEIFSREAWHGEQKMHNEPIALSLEDRRLIGRWAADCAERVLALFEAEAPGDLRPRQAIEEIRNFAGGGKRTAHLRNAAVAALAAAREVGDPAGAAAARSAGLAAATAYTKALSAPHHAKHALGPVVYAALARELAVDGDSSVGGEELRWAIEHASPDVREVVCRWPVRDRGRTRLSVLFYQLDSGLRD